MVIAALLVVAAAVASMTSAGPLFNLYDYGDIIGDLLCALACSEDYEYSEEDECGDDDDEETTTACPSGSTAKTTPSPSGESSTGTGTEKAGTASKTSSTGSTTEAGRSTTVMAEPAKPGNVTDAPPVMMGMKPADDKKDDMATPAE